MDKYDFDRLCVRLISEWSLSETSFLFVPNASINFEILRKAFESLAVSSTCPCGHRRQVKLHSFRSVKIVAFDSLADQYAFPYAGIVCLNESSMH
jgi:hypothetical protein